MSIFQRLKNDSTQISIPFVSAPIFIFSIPNFENYTAPWEIRGKKKTTDSLQAVLILKLSSQYSITTKTKFQLKKKMTFKCFWESSSPLELRVQIRCTNILKPKNEKQLHNAKPISPKSRTRWYVSCITNP